jgi:small-conductance mechanosensitive channel
MDFFGIYSKQIIISIAIVIFVFVLRFFIAKLIRKYAQTTAIIEHRTNLVIKYINILITILSIVGFIIVWGVERKDILLTFSSVATIIGVTMFAQWSILSNVTSGVILFFFFPFKIGDIIKIHDKDFPIQAEILDISAFHVDLKTSEGELITYPNNLLLQKGISIIKTNIEDKNFED